MRLSIQYATLGPDMDEGEMRCLVYDASARGSVDEQFLELALAFHDTWRELNNLRLELRKLKEEFGLETLEEPGGVDV